MTFTSHKAVPRKLGSPAFVVPGFPGLRNSGFPILLICTTALAGCVTQPMPPDINYDDATAAVQTVDPPAPVKVVEVPKVLPLPGQLKPVGKDEKPAPDLPDPAARVNEANAAARMQPVRNGFINAIQVYPFIDGALYQVYTSPGRSPTLRSSQGSSSSVPARSPPVIRCAGSSATPKAARARPSRFISWSNRRGPN